MDVCGDAFAGKWSPHTRDSFAKCIMKVEVTIKVDRKMIRVQLLQEVPPRS